MALDRRDFLLLASATALSYGPSLASAEDAMSSRFKIIAFDAFPIFDPRPIAALAEALFPGNGAALTNAWRVRQFDYQWLRALSGRYVDFIQATDASLLFAAKQLQLELTRDKQSELMAAWSNLRVWPDVPAAIDTLHKGGLRLALLSNMTAAVLSNGLTHAGIQDAFDAVLSTDQIKTYKPDPRAYQMALDRFGVPREQILFVPFAGWDVAGAKWFGYPTFWVNRQRSPMEELGIEAYATGEDLSSLVRFVLA